MVKLDNIIFSYKNAATTAQKDAKPVLNGFSMQISRGETVAVMGESGSGKTTLIKLILGILSPQSGSVDIAAKRISVVFQEDRLLSWYSARENAALAIDGCGKKQSARIAGEYLDKLEILPFADKPISELSGGMQRRVSIARALAFGGDMLILDEPLKGLDEQLKARTARIIKERFDTVLLITHDEDELKLFDCKRVYHLNDRLDK